MYKVIIWGTGSEYNRHLNLIKFFEMLGEIEVQGVTSNETGITTIDGYDFIEKQYVLNLEYDFCLVAIHDYRSVYGEEDQIYFPMDKLIPIHVLEIPHFSFQKYLKLKSSNISILSKNCWAGFCYHYLGLEFLSPTINLFFNEMDFNRFLRRLDYYLSVPLEFVEMRYGNKVKASYPVGKLDDIMLHFNHYNSFDSAKKSWVRRKKRINNENLFIVSNSIVTEEIREFDNLPFQNKIIFVPKELNINSSSCIPVNYKIGRQDITLGEYINSTANGDLSCFDILALLNKEKYLRNSD